MNRRGRNRKHTLTVAGAAAAAVMLAMLVAPAASASPAAYSGDDPRCPHKTFCLYQNANFTGLLLWFGAPGSDYYDGMSSDCDFTRDYDYQGPIDNRASSMINNTTHYVTLYRNLGCGGDQYIAQPRSEDSTFTNNAVVGGNFDNKASGLRMH